MTPNYPINPCKYGTHHSPMLKLLLILKQNTIHDQFGHTHIGLIKMITSSRIDNIELNFKEKYQYTVTPNNVRKHLKIRRR